MSWTDSLRFNPYGGASAILLIISPLLTWITIASVVGYQGVVIFGTAAQSNLFGISSQQLGTNISSIAATGALLAVILLVAGGLVVLKSAKIGVPLSVAGLLAYLLPMYPTFGTTSFGSEYTFISPGIGFFVAAAGIVLGAMSPLSRPKTLMDLMAEIKTQRGLSNLGVFIGVVALTLDFMNHFALGQVPDFIGDGVVEWTLHLGLVAGIASLFAVVALGARVDRERWLLVISAATLILLGVDATYNTFYGSLGSFLGHNITETVLHTAVYYGVALVIISSLGRVLRAPTKPMLAEDSTPSGP